MAMDLQADPLCLPQAPSIISYLSLQSGDR